MEVTLKVEKSGTSVHVYDAGNYYDVNALDRIIEQLRVARRWLAKDRAMRGLESK